MNRFQVTAKFGNIFEVVGNDTVDETTAHQLFNKFSNVGREVRMYQIIGSGSRIIKETAAR